MSGGTTSEATRTFDPAEVRQRLRGDGFAVLPGLLPAEPVRALRQRVGEVLDRHGWLAPGTAPADLTPDANRRDGSPGWWHMYEDLQRLEDLHRLTHHRAVTTAMRELVGGGPLLNHPRRYLNLIPPAFRVPPHQEYLPVQGTPDTLTAWIPLTEYGADTCSLRILRGARSVRPLTTLADVGGAESAAPPSDDPRWSTGERLVPGDVVVLHGLTLWGCDENRTDHLAGALLARYQSARLPVCKASLEPHHYPRVHGWPDLTRGWSSRRWIRVPWSRRVVTFAFADSLETWHERVPQPEPTLVDLHDD